MYAMPDSLRPVLVARDCVVRNVFDEADYTKRLEPTTALEWVDGL